MALGLGLGFANPELKRAQLLAQLNGSTALPQGAGGPPPIADSQGGPAAPPVAAQPQMPMQQQQAPSPADLARAGAAAGMQQAQGGQPNIDPTGQGAGSVKGADGKTDWGKVIGGIGYALLAADAGYHGRGIPSPPDYLTDDGSKQQDQDMQVAEFLVNTTARAWEVSRKAPPGARESMLEQFKGAIAKVAPGFDLDAFLNSMQSDAERADQMAPDLATMSEDAKRMYLSQVEARGGSAEAAADVLKDEQFMAGLMSFEDKRNSGAIRYKGAALQAATKKLGANLGELDIDAFLGLNEQLPDQVRLSPSELATIRRNPALQQLLGLRGAEQPENPTLESRAGAAEPAPGAPQSPVAPRPPARAARPPTEPRAAQRSPQAQEPPQGQRPARPTRPRGPMPQIQPPGNPKPGEDFFDYLARWGGTEARRLTDAGVDPDEAVAMINEVRQRAEARQGGRQQPAPTQARKPAGGEPPAKRQKPAEGQTQRFETPKDMELPGIGKVKAGDTVIYDPKTGKYRRG